MDNTLLACSNDLCIFGNRIHYLYDTNHICVWTWKTLAEQPRKRKSFGYEIIDALGIEFQKAKDVVHPVVGMKSHLTIAVSNPGKYILCGILLTMIPTILIWSVSNWWIAFFSCIILGFVCSIQLMQWYKRNRDKACQELLHTSQIYVFCDNPWCRKIFEE